MKSKLYSVLAIAAAMFCLKPVLAADIKVDGFVDIIYTITDEASDVPGGKNPAEGKFLADAEVDFASKLSDTVSVRVDMDLALAANGGVNAGLAGPADSAVLEQAFFAWSLPKDLTLIGGLFNNPVGWEAEDAPDLYQTSHSANWNILDSQTALHGNNIAGVALAGKIGPVTLTGAFIDDLGLAPEENSLAIVANMTAMKGLDLELGYVTQDNDITAAGNVMDFNAVYTLNKLTLVFELLTADAIIDSSILLLGNYDFGNKFGITGRYETISFDGPGSDTDIITLAGIYTPADNLSILLEWNTTDTGTTDADMLTAEFIALF